MRLYHWEGYNQQGQFSLIYILGILKTAVKSTLFKGFLMIRARLIALLLVTIILGGCSLNESIGFSSNQNSPLQTVEVINSIQRFTPTKSHTKSSKTPSHQSAGTARITNTSPTKSVVPRASETPNFTPTKVSMVPTPDGNSSRSVTLCSPLAEFPRENLSKIISTAYSPPPLGWDDRHHGVDFVYHRLAGVDRTILGVGVQAVLSGWVAAAIEESFPYGNLVIIETPWKLLSPEMADELVINEDQSLYHLYAHLLETPVINIDQPVDACDLIGYVGASGNTEAPHLHFETRIGLSGGRFPVMNAFLEGVTEEERQNYNLWRTSKQYNHFNPMILLDYGIGD